MRVIVYLLLSTAKVTCTWTRKLQSGLVDAYIFFAYDDIFLASQRHDSISSCSGRFLGAFDFKLLFLST